jgi:hypothetical protein
MTPSDAPLLMLMMPLFRQRVGSRNHKKIVRGRRDSWIHMGRFVDVFLYVVSHVFTKMRIACTRILWAIDSTSYRRGAIAPLHRYFVAIRTRVDACYLCIGNYRSFYSQMVLLLDSKSLPP